MDFVFYLQSHILVRFAILQCRSVWFLCSIYIPTSWYVIMTELERLVEIEPLRGRI